MNAPAKDPTRKDLTNAVASIFFVLALWCAPEVASMARHGMFITRLSPALPGGIVAADLPPGLTSFYIAALSAKYLLLAATGILIARAVIPMMHGSIFTARNAQSLKYASWAAMAWILVRLGAEGLSNNFAAHELGIDWWWTSPGAGTPLSDLAPAFILSITLGVLSTVVKRGMALEEEADGLV